MIRKFIAERAAWIALVPVILFFISFVAYVDSSIPLMPVLYIVFLAALLFIVFIVLRYQKEVRFYKSLEQWESDLDVASLAAAESPFEQIVEDVISSQTARLKREASAHLLALEQEKDDLLSWIHEVKTPLTAMHLIIERLDDEPVKAQLSHEWLRIHLLLDQQLHQKRILFMENDLHIEKLDVKPIIFGEIKALQSWCIQKGIGFEVELEAAEVFSNGKWLAFILRQLLTNAVKYSEPSSDIWVTSCEEHGVPVIRVRDTGRGIDPKDLSRIFDRGFTSTTEHQDHAATGMGLYLAKKAAETLLIRIDVNSARGEGTTFSLTFPHRNEFHRLTGM